MLKRKTKQLSLHFFQELYSIFYDFRSHRHSLGILFKSKEKEKPNPGAGPVFGPRPSALWASGLHCRWGFMAERTGRAGLAQQPQRLTPAV
jgi:hypothetical protein